MSVSSEFPAPRALVTTFCCHLCSMSSYLPFSVGSLGNSYGWRSTYLFHKEDEELSGLRLAGVATVDVYVSGRFVEHLASVNRLGFATFQLSDDASIQHVCEHICIMLMCRHDLARREKDGFDQASFPGTSGRVLVIRDVSFAIWRFALRLAIGTAPMQE